MYHNFFLRLVKFIVLWAFCISVFLLLVSAVALIESGNVLFFWMVLVIALELWAANVTCLSWDDVYALSGYKFLYRLFHR